MDTSARTGVTRDAGAMLCMAGQGVVKGYAIGKAVVMGVTALEVAHYRIAPDAVDAECKRLRSAMAVARDELARLAETLPDDAPRELEPLLTVHSLLLDDPGLIDAVCALISDHHYNAEWALTTQGQLLEEQFSMMADEYLRERGSDIRQVIERVLGVLSGTSGSALPDIDTQYPDESLIVVARDIAPADMLRLRDGRFSAFLTDLGGPTSHTAIVARSMNVPAVVGMGHFRSLVRDGDLLVVDGFTGAVLVNPSSLVLDEYLQRKADFLQQRQELAQLRDAPTVTADGVTIELHANIEQPEEARSALDAGADGIGLFRTEFLFMNRRQLPSEDEQFNAYADVVKTMAGRPVTIRTLDAGADKALDDDMVVATNPALGRRAVRYCLAHPEIFITQLRALLRASRFGHIRILIPMLTNLHEVQEVRHALEIAKNQLRARKDDAPFDVSLGAMVETPAVAIAIEPFAQALDFLSIGTNDLIQYTLAVDRGDGDVAHLYDPLHPAVLRLIANVISAGERYGVPVAMCGEMAGNAELARLLLGLGLRSFSMHPQQLLDVKKEIVGAQTATLRSAVTSALNHSEPIRLASLS